MQRTLANLLGSLRLLARGAFNLLRANDLIWTFVVNNYLLGRDPFPFDLLYWNSDSTRMPAAMHSYYLRNMYLRNLLPQPGGIVLNDTPIDLGKVDIPLYFISGTGQQETAASAAPIFAIAAFVVWTIGLSILFTWLFNQTGGSLIVMLLFHAAVNLGAFVPAAVGSTGAASFLYALVTWIVALIVAARFGHENLATRARQVVAGA